MRTKQRQCKLTRYVPESEGGGFAWQIVWLPSDVARTGATLSLQREDGEWHEWLVEHAGYEREAHPPKTTWASLTGDGRAGER